MGLSVLEIWNGALGLSGTRTDINSLTERSREAELCTQWYPIVRRRVLASAHWAEASQSARLAVLAERTNVEWTSAEPSPPWTFAYAWPSDMIAPRYLTDYSRFECGQFDNKRAILSDTANAVVTYTKDETSTGLWTTWLENAVMYGLAAMIIRPLSGSSRKTQELIAEANNNIMLAREMNGSLYEAPMDWLPDWISARGYSNVPSPNRFIYQVGPLLSAGVA